MKFKKCLITIFFMNLLVSKPILADDKSNEIDELETMVVSATPGKVQAVRDVQASVEVITPQRLKSLSDQQ